MGDRFSWKRNICDYGVSIRYAAAAIATQSLSPRINFTGEEEEVFHGERNN